MWKYVVTWCIVVMTIEPSIPVPDEFGRTPATFGYETLENRIRFTDDCNHERWFDDGTEAFAFYSRAVNDRSRGPNLSGQLTNIKIDSVWQAEIYDTIEVIILDRSQIADSIVCRPSYLTSPLGFGTSIEMAVDLPDSTIIGYKFITYEDATGCKSLYSAYNAEYEYLDKLAKADRLIKNYEYVENLFTWVHCKENDVRCFNEQFMREVVDTNPWTTREDYRYIRSEPIYYVDFKRGCLSSVFDPY